MTKKLLPLGFIPLDEAVAKVELAAFAGMPDRAEVRNVKTRGLDVGDQASRNQAFRTLWDAVDRNQLRIVVIGGMPRKIIGLTSDQSKGIPFLRNPQVGNFSMVRAFHKAHKDLVAWFGLDFASAIVVFRKIEIARLSKVLRRRRRAHPAASSKRPARRPSRYAEIAPLIVNLIDQKSWSTIQSLKKPTRLVNRRLGSKLVSEDTVTRVLDRLHSETSRAADRRRARPTSLGALKRQVWARSQGMRPVTQERRALDPPCEETFMGPEVPPSRSGS